MKKHVQYGKRGMHLEQAIEHANEIYRIKGLALVDKTPTPWNVRYNPKKRVNTAWPEKKGTVDFIGVSNGRALAFEAKTTNTDTSFPLSNVQKHQVDYLMDHDKQHGIAFMIVFFENLYEFYYLSVGQLHKWWMHSHAGGRKSIPHSWFVANCPKIKSRNGVAVDYLPHCM